MVIAAPAAARTGPSSHQPRGSTPHTPSEAVENVAPTPLKRGYRSNRPELPHGQGVRSPIRIHAGRVEVHKGQTHAITFALADASRPFLTENEQPEVP